MHCFTISAISGDTKAIRIVPSQGFAASDAFIVAADGVCWLTLVLFVHFEGLLEGGAKCPRIANRTVRTIFRTYSTFVVVRWEVAKAKLVENPHIWHNRKTKPTSDFVGG
jgi:hypothetical protein